MNVDHILFTAVSGIVSPAWASGLLLLIALTTVAGLPLARRAGEGDAVFALAPTIGLTALVILAALRIPWGVVFGHVRREAAAVRRR